MSSESERLPEPSPQALRQLAYDLSIHWNGRNDDLWQMIDSELWELTHNPALVLSTVPERSLAQWLERPRFCRLLQTLLQEQAARRAGPTWFSRQVGGAPLTQVAYFSMEYMLGEALPIYSGGLGNVAGDQLKAASDLGVPVTAVGILWQQGYFRQEIGPDGRQQALYPLNDTRQLPVEPLLREDGSPLRLAMRLPGISIWLRGWQAQVGRTRLLLLDSNDPANPPPVRLITSELYGGDLEMRLRQELVLGIGGWRLLEAAGLAPEVCHLNDGHAAFVALERARSYMQARNVSFAVALTATRAGNLFTTHTPVEAGFDRFPPSLIGKYLQHYAEHELCIGLPRLLALGQARPEVAGEPFNMAWLATRCAGAVNAVSRLHGQTSRSIFRELFVRWPLAEVPVGHVTNGVHVPTWLSADAELRWRTLYGAQEPWQGEPQRPLAEHLARLDDAQLWQMRQHARRELVAFARGHLARSLAVHGASARQIEEAGHGLDPEVLTLGFARRFASYKRPNLLLADPERLLRLLCSHERPVQLLVAGKAHPADEQGQRLLAEWQAFLARPALAGRVVFLEDYDMGLARRLVQGVDVWLNTPRRPWEASGTSGMKVLANGGLNLSQHDGWWAEAYTPELGWCIGDGGVHGPSDDAVDAAELYRLLEQEVVPLFYARGQDGLPRGWVQRMRCSMAALVERFSADRSVREYCLDYYLPAARAYRKRSAEGSTRAAELTHLQATLQRLWPELAFVRVTLRPEAGGYDAEVVLHLGELRPEQLQVQLYAEPEAATAEASVHPLALVEGMGQQALFRGHIDTRRPAEDFSARVLPGGHLGLAVPLELPLIAWQR